MSTPPGTAPGTAPNAAQAEYWNGRAGERWASWYERLDRGMADITAALMRHAAPSAGERVLDVGCGCGTSALLAARAVAPGGSVDAIDVSKPMLEVARTRAQAEKAPVRVLQGDASSFALEGPYDLIQSRFGVMFFDDPLAAFSHLRARLRPGGRFVFVTWRQFSQNTWAHGPYQAALPLLPPPAPAVPGAPGPFAFADAERLLGLLGKAGFAQAHVQAIDQRLGLGATVDEAVEQVMHIGPLAAASAELDRGVRHEVAGRARTLLEGWKTADGVTGLAACWLVRAQV